MRLSGDLGKPPHRDAHHRPLELLEAFRFLVGNRDVDRVLRGRGRLRLSERRKLVLDPLELAAWLDQPEDGRAAEDRSAHAPARRALQAPTRHRGL